MSETTGTEAKPQANGHKNVADEAVRNTAPHVLRQEPGAPKPPPPYEPDPAPEARPVTLEAGPLEAPAVPFGSVALGGLICGIAGGLLYIGLDLMTGGRLSALFGGAAWVPPDEEPEE